MKQRYTKDELYDFEPQRTFSNKASEAAFLLGGIGTGNVSVGARGEFRDWEIFNRPGKGNYLPHTFFAVRTEGNDKSIAKVLEAQLNPPFSNSHGFISPEVGGLPRFSSSRLKGEYPFVQVSLEDDKVPLDITMEAFTPFVPLDEVNSGIPGAIVRYTVQNKSDYKQRVSVVGSLVNDTGFDGYDVFRNIKLVEEGSNRFRKDDKLTGIEMASDLPYDHKTFGSMALVTTDKIGITCKPEWLRGGWYDGITDFWDDFTSDGRLEAESVFEARGNTIVPPMGNVGSLCLEKEIEPGEEQTFEFMLAWYFPNRTNNWNEDYCNCGGNECCEPEIVRNYYVNVFDSAWDVVNYLASNIETLEGLSRKFHKAFFNTTLPSFVLDAVSSNITVIRSTTCFWLEDGTFAAYEGCHDTNGCCPGSCTHVWNYAQTLAFFFPKLERKMRQIEFHDETDQEGEMSFRTLTVFDQSASKTRMIFPAAPMVSQGCRKGLS